MVPRGCKLDEPMSLLEDKFMNKKKQENKGNKLQNSSIVKNHTYLNGSSNNNA
jgi:hypothetical protein